MRIRYSLVEGNHLGFLVLGYLLRAPFILPRFEPPIRAPMSINLRPIRSPGARSWSVFDAVRSFPSTPEALMSEIDAAIASTEYSRSSPPPPDANSSTEEERVGPTTSSPASSYDAQIADEAYKSACAALAARRPDAAVRSLQVALESCPPDKASAIAKLRSLLAIANSQLQKTQQKKPLLK